MAALADSWLICRRVRGGWTPVDGLPECRFEDQAQRLLFDLALKHDHQLINDGIDPLSKPAFVELHRIKRKSETLASSPATAGDRALALRVEPLRSLDPSDADRWPKIG